MPSSAIWPLSALILSYLLYICANGKAREELLDRLALQRRRPSTAATPPKGLSPEKQDISDETQQREYAPLGHENAFPPSLRQALKGVFADAHFQLSEPDYNRMLPDKETPHSTQHLGYAIATELTLEDIQQLGDFPDYAMLSGVPLPDAYSERDLRTALPRPYRPFRWSYHQTMSLAKMEPDWWLELNCEYIETIQAHTSESTGRHYEGCPCRVQWCSTSKVSSRQ